MKRNLSVLFVLSLWLGCGGGQSSSDQPRAQAATTAQTAQPGNPQATPPNVEKLPPAVIGEGEAAHTDLRVAQALIAFKGLADEMCSCVSTQCATGVENKIEALGEDYDDLDGQDFSDAQQQELMLAAIRMAQCQAQLVAQTEQS